MDAEKFHEAFNAITALEAREAFIPMKAALLPNMKDESREEVWRDLHKAAYPNTEEPKALTLQEFARKFNGG